MEIHNFCALFYPPCGDATLYERTLKMFSGCELEEVFTPLSRRREAERSSGFFLSSSSLFFLSPHFVYTLAAKLLAKTRLFPSSFFFFPHSCPLNTGRPPLRRWFPAAVTFESSVFFPLISFPK